MATRQIVGSLSASNFQVIFPMYMYCFNYSNHYLFVEKVVSTKIFTLSLSNTLTLIKKNAMLMYIIKLLLKASFTKKTRIIHENLIDAHKILFA